MSQKVYTFDSALYVASTVAQKSTVKTYSPVLSDITEDSILNYAVATGVTDQSIALPGQTTAKGVIITTDHDVSFKVNGGDTAIPLNADGLFVMFKTEVTSLSVSNSSGSKATIHVVLISDEDQ